MRLVLSLTGSCLQTVTVAKGKKDQLSWRRFKKVTMDAELKFQGYRDKA